MVCYSAYAVPDAVARVHGSREAGGREKLFVNELLRALLCLRRGCQIMTVEPFPDVTLVVTSCGRYDLLRRTLASMDPWLARFPNRLLVEDGPGEEADLAYLRRSGFKVLVNGRTLGQHVAIDRAYAEIQTSFIFHVEDDWEFLREPDIVTAISILEAGIDGYQRVSSVCFSDRTELSWFCQETFREITINGSHYRYSLDPQHHQNAFTFHPHLLRCDFAKKIGPYSLFRSEGGIARFLYRRAYIVVTETPKCVRHIGDGRHIPIKRTTRIMRLSIRWKRFLEKALGMPLRRGGV